VGWQQRCFRDNVESCLVQFLIDDEIGGYAFFFLLSHSHGSNPETYQTKNVLMAMTTRFSWEHNTFYLTQHTAFLEIPAHKCIFVLYNPSTHKLMERVYSDFDKNMERAFFFLNANRNCNTRKTIRHAS
jgi:hypothetical protein